jgi:serine/threonine-protein kinase
MELKGRVWTAGKIVLLAGSLAITFVVSLGISMRLALTAREVRVPDLLNHTANEATAMAGDVGLTVRVDESRRPDAKVAAGRVLAQDPPSGAVARRHRSVKVWLSGGQRTPTVPTLVGETVRTAELRLAQGGLKLARTAEIHSAGAPPDVVVAQSPVAEPPAGQVALLVSRGARASRYVMPDLIGVNADRAAEILRARSFRVALVGLTPYPGVAAGIVLRQTPQPGSQIAPGEPISLEVSR